MTRRLMTRGCRWLAAAALLGSLAGGPARPGGAQESDRGSGETPVASPVFRKLSAYIGGRWVTENKRVDGTPVGELRYEWGAGKRTIVEKSVIAGEPVTAHYGWDPAVGKVYFLSLHGPETVFFGHITMEGDELVTEFKSLVGAPAAFRSRERLSDPDTLTSTIQAQRDGRWVDAHKLKLLRHR